MGEGRSKTAIRNGLHPLWWAALVVLIVNDHFLKGSGLVPPMVTGKLSDAAGLIVAPILLSRFIQWGRADSIPLRAIAFGSVGAIFALVNLSQTCADRLAAVPTALGLPSRLWADTSDLWALLVLPIAWMLERPPVLAASRGTGQYMCRESWWRLGAFLGSLACLATSSYEEEVLASSYLVNGTRYELGIEVHPAPEGLDCETLKDDPFAALSLDDFQDGVCETIQPFDRFVLDPHALSEGDEESALVDAHCDAALIRVEGAAPAVLVWGSSPRVKVAFRPIYPDFEEVLSDPHSVVVEQLGDERFLALGSHIQVFEVTDDGAVPAASCRSPE